jgi:malate dehydrogenase (oxaloacetate-decarboxylating)
MVAQQTNRQMKHGDLATAIKHADVFIGVSVAGAVTSEMVESMNTDPIIFALANSNPEILPEAAIAAGAKVVCT